MENRSVSDDLNLVIDFCVYKAQCVNKYNSKWLSYFIYAVPLRGSMRCLSCKQRVAWMHLEETH